MIIILFGFLFGLRVKPVYSVAFKNEIVDVSYNKYGYPMFVLTAEDIYALNMRGKKMFDKPKMGIYIPSSVYTLCIGKENIEYINFRGRISHTIKAPDGVFLGASKNLFHLFWKDKNSVSAINYDGKLLWKIKSSGSYIIFPDGKLLFVGKSMSLYNQEGNKIWERDNITGENPAFILQEIAKNSNNFILYDKFSGLYAGFGIAGKNFWIKNRGKPIYLSNNAKYFFVLEGKNFASVYKFISGKAVWGNAFPANISTGIVLDNGYLILGGINRAYIVNKEGDIQKIIRKVKTPYKIFYKDSILTLVGKKTISTYKVRIK